MNPKSHDNYDNIWTGIRSLKNSPIFIPKTNFSVLELVEPGHTLTNLEVIEQIMPQGAEEDGTYSFDEEYVKYWELVNKSLNIAFEASQNENDQFQEIIVSEGADPRSVFDEWQNKEAEQSMPTARAERRARTMAKRSDHVVEGVPNSMLDLWRSIESVQDSAAKKQMMDEVIEAVHAPSIAAMRSLVARAIAVGIKINSQEEGGVPRKFSQLAANDKLENEDLKFFNNLVNDLVSSDGTKCLSVQVGEELSAEIGAETQIQSAISVSQAINSSNAITTMGAPDGELRKTVLDFDKLPNDLPMICLDCGGICCCTKSIDHDELLNQRRMWNDFSSSPHYCSSEILTLEPWFLGTIAPHDGSMPGDIISGVCNIAPSKKFKSVGIPIGSVANTSNFSILILDDELTDQNRQWFLAKPAIDAMNTMTTKSIAEAVTDMNNGGDLYKYPYFANWLFLKNLILKSFVKSFGSIQEEQDVDEKPDSMSEKEADLAEKNINSIANLFVGLFEAIRNVENLADDNKQWSKTDFILDQIQQNKLNNLIEVSNFEHWKMAKSMNAIPCNVYFSRIICDESATFISNKIMTMLDSIQDNVERGLYASAIFNILLKKDVEIVSELDISAALHTAYGITNLLRANNLLGRTSEILDRFIPSHDSDNARHSEHATQRERRVAQSQYSIDPVSLEVAIRHISNGNYTGNFEISPRNKYGTCNINGASPRAFIQYMRLNEHSMATPEMLLGDAINFNGHSADSKRGLDLPSVNAMLGRNKSPYDTSISAAELSCYEFDLAKAMWLSSYEKVGDHNQLWEKKLWAMNRYIVRRAHNMFCDSPYYSYYENKLEFHGERLFQGDNLCDATNNYAMIMRKAELDRGENKDFFKDYLKNDDQAWRNIVPEYIFSNDESNSGAVKKEKTFWDEYDAGTLDNFAVSPLSSDALWRLIELGQEECNRVLSAAKSTDFSHYLKMKKSILLRYLGQTKFASNNASGLKEVNAFIDVAIKSEDLIYLIKAASSNSFDGSNFANATKCIGFMEVLVSLTVMCCGNIADFENDEQLNNLRSKLDSISKTIKKITGNIFNASSKINLNYLGRILLTASELGVFKNLEELNSALTTIQTLFEITDQTLPEKLKQFLESGIFVESDRWSNGYSKKIEDSIKKTGTLSQFVSAVDVGDAPSGFIDNDSLVLRTQEIKDRIFSLSHVFGVLPSVRAPINDPNNKLISKISLMFLDVANKLETIANLRYQISETKDDLSRLSVKTDNIGLDVNLVTLSDSASSEGNATLLNVGCKIIDGLYGAFRDVSLYHRMLKIASEQPESDGTAGCIMFSLCSKFLSAVFNGVLSPLYETNSQNDQTSYDKEIGTVTNAIGTIIDAFAMSREDAEVVLSFFKSMMGSIEHGNIFTTMKHSSTKSSALTLKKMIEEDLLIGKSFWNVDLAKGFVNEEYIAPFANGHVKLSEVLKNKTIDDIISSYKKSINPSFEFSKSENRSPVVHFMNQTTPCFEILCTMANTYEKIDKIHETNRAKAMAIAVTEFVPLIAELVGRTEKIRESYLMKSNALGAVSASAKMSLIERCMKRGELDIVNSQFDFMTRSIGEKQEEMARQLDDLSTMAKPFFKLLNGIENGGDIDDDGSTIDDLCTTTEGLNFFKALKSYGGISNDAPSINKKPENSSLNKFDYTPTLCAALRDELGSMLMKHETYKRYEKVKDEDSMPLDVQLANFQQAVQADNGATSNIGLMTLPEMGCVLHDKDSESGERKDIINRIDVSVRGCALAENIIAGVQAGGRLMKPDHAQITGHIFGGLLSGKEQIVMNAMPTGSGKTSMALPMQVAEQISRGKQIVVLTHDKKAADDIGQNNMLQEVTKTAFRLRNGTDIEDARVLKSLDETESKATGGTNYLVSCTQPNPFLFYLQRRKQSGAPKSENTFLFFDEADQTLLDRDSSGNFRQTKKAGRLTNNPTEMQQFYESAINKMLALARDYNIHTTEEMARKFEIEYDPRSAKFREQMLTKIAEFAFDGYEVQEEDKSRYASELLFALSMEHGEHFAPVKEGDDIKILCLDQNSGEYLSQNTRFVGDLSHKVLEARMGASIGYRDLTVSSCSYFRTFVECGGRGVTATPASEVENFLLGAAMAAISVVDYEEEFQCGLKILKIPPALPNNRIEFPEPVVVDSSLVFDGKFGLPAFINQLLMHESTSVQISVENSEKALGLTDKLKEWARLQCESGVDLIRPEEISTINADSEVRDRETSNYDPISIIANVGAGRNSDGSSKGLKILITDQTGHRAQDIKAPNHTQVLFFEGTARKAGDRPTSSDSLLFECGNCSVEMKTRHTDRTLTQCIGRAGRRGKPGQVHYFYAVDNLQSFENDAGFDGKNLKSSARDALIDRGIKTEVEARNRAYKNILAGVFGAKNDDFLHVNLFEMWMTHALGMSDGESSVAQWPMVLKFVHDFGKKHSINTFLNRSAFVLRKILISANENIAADAVDKSVSDFFDGKTQDIAAFNEQEILSLSSEIKKDLWENIRQLLQSAYVEEMAPEMDKLHSFFASESQFFKSDQSTRRDNITKLQNSLSLFIHKSLSALKTDVPLDFVPRLVQQHMEKIADMSDRIEDANKVWEKAVTTVYECNSSMKPANNNEINPPAKKVLENDQINKRPMAATTASSVMLISCGGALLATTAGLVAGYFSGSKVITDVVDDISAMNSQLKIGGGAMAIAMCTSFLGIALISIGIALFCHEAKKDRKSSLPVATIVAPWRANNLADDPKKLADIMKKR